jgi:hypothetical protein
VTGGYVDDGRQGTSKIKEGMRFNGDTRKLEYREEWKEEDIKAGETTLKRMSKVCQEVMNSINPDLEFTVETHEDYEDGMLPTLDFKIEVVKGQITHTYFEKPMRNQLVLMERTAMAESQKYQILFNELICRLSQVSKEMGK